MSTSPSRAPTRRTRERCDAPPAEQSRPTLLGRLLADRGAVSEADLEAALAEQLETGRRIGEVLVRRGATDEEMVARLLARQLSLPYEPPPLEPSPNALSCVRRELLQARSVVPLEIRGRTLRLATADPLDLAAMDDIRFQTGKRVDAVVTTPGAVERVLGEVPEGELDALLNELPATAGGDEGSDPHSLEVAARSAPVVRLVDHLLRRAASEDVSDIHLESGDEAFRVRYRVDGVLRKVTELPSGSRGPVLSRLKVMAGLDIAVKRRPQDGSFSFGGTGRELTIRLSTLPTAEGEKAVLRLLDPRRAPGGVDELGLSPEDLELLRRLLRSGQGVILAAGPTGSGKSSTLFGALAEVDRDRQNVVTLEDPVEYRLGGVSQVQVDPRAGLSFPAALRSVLRQDPDVIMVGEIRDRETAEIAMAAAVTGHLVLSTIHTTDGPGAVARLVNMGVPPYLVAGGLTGVVAQRLVRRLCRKCLGREPDCPACPDGFRGRTGVFQVLAMSDPLRDAVIRGARTGDIRRLAREAGMKSLLEDARRKVAEGLTSVHEISRAVSGSGGVALPCPSCGGEMPAGSTGCPSCGARRLHHCPCGREIERGWRFCPGCLRPVRRG